ncbi:FecR family protein [Mucilaginibacter segetis]|uniref:FecR family protein n=1 Tax=Mucilaginibacter segetis TaxID=2793071 RepID=A0A934PSC5_9SPHI|nr:FecR family protein [Mucilaginibacter segetis]MBK0378737.1 FecR family protein [Mucilaginibacter segetis]
MFWWKATLYTSLNKVKRVNWELLLRYINKEASNFEATQVEEWLQQQKENAYLLEYLQKRKDQLHQPLKETDIDEQWLHLLDRIFETSPFVKPIKLYRYLGIAASFLLFAVLGWMYVKNSTSGTKADLVTLQAPVDTRGNTLLPDGTQVYMTPGSSIKYGDNFGADKRIIHLSGEAFFDVKHDPKKPFIIYTTNNLQVSVLGTSFNVYSSKNGLPAEIKVASGLVGITASQHTYFLKAGQKLTYQPNNKKTAITTVTYNDAAALQNQALFFKDDNAYQIAEKLHRWYNIDVEVLPSATKHSRFSGEMKDAGLANLMEGLKYATGINYKFKDQHTIQLF